MATRATHASDPGACGKHLRRDAWNPRFVDDARRIGQKFQELEREGLIE
jgi:hypothetical protein